MKYLPPESPLRRLIEINALDAETCEQIIREVEQYVVDRYETIEPRLRLSVTVTIPAEHSISGAAFYLHNETTRILMTGDESRIAGHNITYDLVDRIVSLFIQCFIDNTKDLLNGSRCLLFNSEILCVT